MRPSTHRNCPTFSIVVPLLYDARGWAHPLASYLFAGFFVPVGQGSSGSDFKKGSSLLRLVLESLLWP